LGTNKKGGVGGEGNRYDKEFGKEEGEGGRREMEFAGIKIRRFKTNENRGTKEKGSRNAEGEESGGKTSHFYHVRKRK